MSKAIDKLDNIKKDKFVEFYGRDEVRGNISVTCSAVGISRQTYYDWLEKDKKFRSLIKEEKLKLCDDMEQILISRAVDKSDTALIYWLKYNHKKYKEEKAQGLNQINIGKVYIELPKRKFREEEIVEAVAETTASS